MSQGMKQAVDEINAKGGVDGIKLEAEIEDHKGGGGQDGVAAMNRLIAIHQVQAVLTSFSAPTIAAVITIGFMSLPSRCAVCPSG